MSIQHCSPNAVQSLITFHAFISDGNCQLHNYLKLIVDCIKYSFDEQCQIYGILWR